MNFSSVLMNELLRDLVCITNDSIQQCAARDKGELRGKLLEHVQEKCHLGKYTDYISGKLANALLVQASFQLLMTMELQGTFSQKMPVVEKSGIYNTIDTKAWLAKEKCKAAAAAISINQWAKYQVPFQAAVTASMTTARLLEKINRKDSTTQTGKEEIRDDITTVLNRSLAIFKQELAKIDVLNKDRSMQFNMTSIMMSLHMDFGDFISNTETYLDKLMKVEKKMEKAVKQLKKIEQFFDQCINGIQAQLDPV